MQSSFRAAALLVSAALVCSPLPGCSQFPDGMVSGQELTIEASDPCGAQRAEFDRSGSFFSREVAARTLTGAVLGAGSGALIGAIAGGGQGALSGALAGLAGGAAIGLASAYWERLQQTSLDQQTLSQTVNQDLRTESDSIDHTAATFANLRACRFAQAQQVKFDAGRGSISREEAQGRLARQRAWFDQEMVLAQRVGMSMQKRDAEFAYAAEQLHQPILPQPHPSSGPSAVRMRSEPSIAAATIATQTIPQKRNSFETAVGTAKTESATAFSLDTSATTRNQRQGDA